MLTTVLAPDALGLSTAAAHLRAGGIVGMPTETVYGLAAIADDPAAVLRVFEAKNRPLFDPLIVHLADAEQLGAYVALENWTVPARRTVQALAAWWPAPLTLVLPRRPEVPDLVTSGLPTVAVRVPAHPVARALITAAGAGLAAPSANRFGRISPTTAAAVVEELGDRVAYVLDGGPCTVGVESTVVRVCDDGSLDVLRPGGVPVEALAAVAPVHRGGPAAPDPSPTIAAPGQLPSHYAPRTPLTLVEGPIDGAAALPPRALAILVARGEAEPVVRRLRARGYRVVAACSLSAAGDPAEASRQLFAALRTLDHSGADDIVAEQWPDGTGLGFALRDRLARASRVG